MSQGPIGPTGLPGPQGPQGPQGTVGSDGMTGIEGQRGIQGERGLQGPRGSTGPLGLSAEPIQAQTVYTESSDDGSIGVNNRTLTTYNPPLANGSVTIPFLNAGNFAGDTFFTLVPPGTYLIRAWASTSQQVKNSFIELSSVVDNNSTLTYSTLLTGTNTEGGVSHIHDTYTFTANTNVLMRQNTTGAGNLSPSYTGTKASITFIRLR